MTASPIRRMGTSVGIAGGSLAEVLNTRQKVRRLKIMVTGGRRALQKYGYPDQGGRAPHRHLDPDNPARAAGSLLSLSSENVRVNCSVKMSAAATRAAGRGCAG
jgi:hypothetical protein